MRKLILASLTLLAISCNREEPPAPVTPVQPAAVHENYVVLNGDGHTNDTFRFVHLCSASVAGDSMLITGQDTTNYYINATCRWSHSFGYFDTIAGTYPVSVWQSGIAVMPINYMPVNANITITSVGGAGGYVEGTYSGSYKRMSAPYTPITVSGKFSVIRN